MIFEYRAKFNKRAGTVEKSEDFLYSSVRDYSGLKGLIEVDYW